uniref:Akirin 1 n=1 Tax=Marmota marmota marmota TaxID=9994 RepID=A0A8C5Z3K1_MARMA
PPAARTWLRRWTKPLRASRPGPERRPPGPAPAYSGRQGSPPGAGAAAAAASAPGPRPHSGPQAPDADQPAPPGSERRLPTPERIFQNIKQECSRYPGWRLLAVVLNQSEACTSERQPRAAALTAPSSPGSSWMRKDRPTFTLRQVGMTCERLLKDDEDEIREEYEQILNTQLAEQYESFVKFTQDQILRRYGTRPTSCVS